MIAAVNLYELTETGSSGTRLVDLRRALLARHPQAGIRHQVTHGFLRQHEAMAFTQLLARQRRTKIGVALVDQFQRPVKHGLRQLMIAAHAAPLRNKTSGAFGAVADHEPLDLAPA
ncbi:hypothetical protein AWB81_06525 [Caballeronia arationis]|nr:hypothetical protein AWB81_06525 [Caballeronia arationis]